MSKTVPLIYAAKESLSYPLWINIDFGYIFVYKLPNKIDKYAATGG